MYLLDLSVQAYDRAFDTTMHTGVRPRIGRDVRNRCATAHWTRCFAQVCDRALDAMFRTGVRPRIGRDVPHRCATAHWTRCSAQVYDRALDAMFSTGVQPRVGRDVPHRCATAHWTRCSAQVCDCTLDAMNRTGVPLRVVINYILSFMYETICLCYVPSPGCHVLTGCIVHYTWLCEDFHVLGTLNCWLIFFGTPQYFFPTTSELLPAPGCVSRLGVCLFAMCRHSEYSLSVCMLTIICLYSKLQVSRTARCSP